jgi:small subunit ribosomal protein S17
MTIDNQKNKRRTTGVVVSNSMDKSATVEVQRRLKHPLYSKYIYKTTKIMIHDEENISNVGDTVLIRESKPISKNKAWILDEVLKTKRAE